MLDETTPKGRLIAAAMKLAAERPWKEISLIEIADAAGMTLADVRADFDGKSAIVRGLVRAVDDALLKDAKRPLAGDGKRDALFEVIMARFDLLAAHKPAIRSIMKDADLDFAMFSSALSSQQWMLAAAGIDASGPGGAVRALGLASVYASVFNIWLDDEDPGMARTMAALDRRLRRGERNLQTVEGVCETVTGFGKRLGEIFAGQRKRREEKPAEPS